MKRPEGGCRGVLLSSGCFLPRTQAIRGQDPEGKLNTIKVCDSREMTAPEPSARPDRSRYRAAISLPPQPRPPSAGAGELVANESDLVGAARSSPAPGAEIYGSGKCHPSPLPVNLPPHLGRLELFG